MSLSMDFSAQEGYHYVGFLDLTRNFLCPLFANDQMPVYEDRVSRRPELRLQPVKNLFVLSSDHVFIRRFSFVKNRDSKDRFA